ncbi:MAG: stage III sporulation protein AD [Peptococcaceae bacterium]|nr:stage III sporulation protein AD [Peptococcaceae bacterium]
MEIIQILGLSLIVLVIYFILQEQKNPVALLLVLAFSLIIFLVVVRQVALIFATLQTISMAAGVNSIYLKTVMKILGIAYLTELVAQLCRDGGSSALALKIELAAKIAILTLALPILLAIIESILQLLR